MQEECGLRERKKRETRRALNSAALDLVEEHGYDAITTEQIAARAGVSARTFFNYFPSKEAAVIGGTGEDLEQAAHALETRPAEEPPLVALRAVLEGMLAPAHLGKEERARRRRVLLGEPALAPAIVGNNVRIENRLTVALEHRLGVDPGKSIDARLTVAVAIAGLRACVEHQQQGGSGQLEDNVDQAFERLAAGLA